MNNFFRALIAGYGAKKLGGGCFGTIIVFIVIWVALGQCSLSSRTVPAPETFPAERRASVFPAETVEGAAMTWPWNAKASAETTPVSRSVSHVFDIDPDIPEELLFLYEWSEVRLLC